MDFYCTLFNILTDPATQLYPEIIDWGGQDYFFQLSYSDRFQEPISRFEFIDGKSESEEI